MSGLKSIRIRRIAGLGGLVIVAALIAAVLAGPATAHHCKGSHPSCDGGADPAGGETATFEITVSGDLGGNVTVSKKANGPESLIHNDGQAVLELDMAGFIVHNGGLTGWGNCFAGGPFSAVVGVNADKNDPGTGNAGFWFTAKGNDGTPDIKYRLAVTPVEIPLPAVWPNWLPDLVGQTVTVTTVPGGSWKLKHANGPGKKVACTGEGTTGNGTGDTLDFTITVKRIS